MSVEDLGALDSVDARRRHMLTAYERRMFEQHSAEQPYTQKQTTHWLSWLAQRMYEQAQTIFLIEELQPIWLPSSRQRQALLIAQLVCGLVLWLGVGLAFGLASGMVEGLTGGLVAGCWVDCLLAVWCAVCTSFHRAY